MEPQGYSSNSKVNWKQFKDIIPLRQKVKSYKIVTFFLSDHERLEIS